MGCCRVIKKWGGAFGPTPLLYFLQWYFLSESVIVFALHALSCTRPDV